MSVYAGTISSLPFPSEYGMNSKGFDNLLRLKSMSCLDGSYGHHYKLSSE